MSALPMATAPTTVGEPLVNILIFGAFIGNVAMGVLFGWLYQRYGRLLPFVIAHFVIDAAIFVGYPWAAAAFPDLLAVPSPSPTPTPTPTTTP